MLMQLFTFFRQFFVHITAFYNVFPLIGQAENVLELTRRLV